MSNEERILTLVPYLQTKARLFLEKANKWLYSHEEWLETDCVIVEAKRDIYYQAGLYSQGRVWVKSKKQWEILYPEAIVTRTLNSKHLSGEAFDIALNTLQGIWFPNPENSGFKEMWLALANIGKDIGLIPGALWEKPDWGHYEIE